MTRWLRHLVSLFAIVGSVTATPALAHPGHSIPLDELTRNAATVFEGTVTGVASAWNGDHSQIYTTVELRKDGIYKGAAPQAVRLTLLGGTVGDITLAVLGQPAFQVDEHVMVFLDAQWSVPGTPVVGGEHGKFTVTRDSRTGREYLINDGIALPKLDAVTTIRSTTAARPANR